MRAMLVKQIGHRTALGPTDASVAIHSAIRYAVEFPQCQTTITRKALASLLARLTT